METIKIKLLNENAVVPTYGTEFSAGADLYAGISENIEIKPGETKVIPTGVSMQIPIGYGGFVYARSGLSIKSGLAPANKVGVIDSDYRGDIMVALYNHSKETKIVEVKERIAQIVIAPFLKVDYTQVDELDETIRGEGGFGSTGNK